MPNLEKLEVRLNFLYGGAPTVIEHLLVPKEILVIVGGCGADKSSTRAAVSALRKAIDMRSCRPTANIECVDDSLFLGRLLDDGFSWRKYGQKDILGAKHPRLVL